MDRLLRALFTSGIAIAFVLAAICGGSRALAQGADTKFDPAVRPEFKEPVTLASKDGVLEVTLTAHQGRAKLDTVAEPVQNFLVFAYRVARGTPSNGAIAADNLYPAPTLQVYPGETPSAACTTRRSAVLRSPYARQSVYRVGRGPAPEAAGAHLGG